MSKQFDGRDRVKFEIQKTRDEAPVKSHYRTLSTRALAPYASHDHAVTRNIDAQRRVLFILFFPRFYMFYGATGDDKRHSVKRSHE